MRSNSLLLINSMFKRTLYKSPNHIIKDRSSSTMDLLKTNLQNRDIKTVQDWKTFRKNVMDVQSNVTDKNIDAMVVGLCTSLQKYDLAFSYLDFLKEVNVKPNLATVGKYLKLLYLRNQNRDNLLEGDERMILSLYDDLRKSYPVLDALTLDNVIQALSLTKDWSKCLDLMEEINKSCSTFSAHCYSSIISACFLNNKEDIGWKLLEEMLVKEKVPQDPVYLSIVKLAKSSESGECDKLEEMFKFMQENHLKCSHLVARKILEIPSLRGTGHLAAIDKKGRCNVCKNELENCELKENEFTVLKTKLLDNVLIGKNVFNKTTPEELKRFMNFIKNSHHYDVVIDGLNVAYSVGIKQSPLVTSGLVASVVSYFVNQKKKVLVLGRNHMSRLPKINWRYVEQNATVFLTQDLSQDDPYLLYCALHCGRDTIIVTRDLMRGHKFLLKDYHDKMMFAKWLHQRQYRLLHVNRDGKAFFKIPSPYMDVAQKIRNCWHVPIENELKDKNNIGNESVSWLCLRMNIKLNQ